MDMASSADDNKPYTFSAEILNATLDILYAILLPQKTAQMVL